MRFVVGEPISIRAWLATPLFFAAAVLGLTALGGLLLGASWQVTLSSALFGGAAAVTLALATSVGWHSAEQRGALAPTYPVLVFAAGLVLHDVRVPTLWAVTIGVPAAVVLAVEMTSPRAPWARGDSNRD
ncbi:hypothetical protein [Actinokineospora sp. NBRC 105648]|uniref:hypothetical protein n=1 Tax=Actinokineospora sp. NBRC 105648 TaxID=3032206 RepID=UPI0024A24405|nr:hypothetical protein [Actinokineospora sp. NBRC 105648]GLZ39109.1 hypothetical protein Acsp05_27330 [Actinokineospora sp. NBRC 105648]